VYAARMKELRLERERALLTQEELAVKAGVSVRIVSYAEAGRPVSIRTKQRILDGLGIPREEHERVFGPVRLEDVPRSRAKSGLLDG